MKNSIIALVVLVLLGVGIYFITKGPKKVEVTNNNSSQTTGTTQKTPSQIAEETFQSQKNAPEIVIGKSVEGRDITAYRFGTGDTEVLFIAGIHGGYEWNTAFLAYQIMDYLKANPSTVPANVKVTVIPVLNPDGLNKTVGSGGRFALADVPSDPKDTVSGRFNANEVDLNRNFDCDWQATGYWQNKTVSAGSAPFSEPESSALKNYIEASKPAAVVAWYSAAGGVFASNCHTGVLDETKSILKVFADASKYPAKDDFDFYEISGDMINWLAKINIPAISVVLTNHTNTESAKNIAGIQALLKHYAK